MEPSRIRLLIKPPPRASQLTVVMPDLCMPPPANWRRRNARKPRRAESARRLRMENFILTVTTAIEEVVGCHAPLARARP